jgi:CDP-glucose 4,6-dehydratase
VSPFDPTFWRDRSVLLTGHTGFKGAWLSLWLQSLGARVHGLSLGTPPTDPSLYELARVAEGMAGSVVCDIRDCEAVRTAVLSAKPEIVIHMAAQPLVRRSFATPHNTYETNVMGTLNVLEAVRACAAAPAGERVRAVVIVTSDKCYENRESSHDENESSHGNARESSHGHRESDPLGGHDPYSSSKAAAELVTSAYRRSYFSDPDSPRVASARAGNVIGGGDWGEDRLMPDIVRASVAGELLRLRHPHAIRPWQHVLSPLSGYLVLAQALCNSPEYACAWNFGPEPGATRTVEWVVQQVSELLANGLRWSSDEGPHPHETHQLELDSSRARTQLGWTPSLELPHALAATVAWYEAWRSGAQDLRALSLEQIEQVQASAEPR